MAGNPVLIECGSGFASSGPSWRIALWLSPWRDGPRASPAHRANGHLTLLATSENSPSGATSRLNLILMACGQEAAFPQAAGGCGLDCVTRRSGARPGTAFPRMFLNPDATADNYVGAAITTEWLLATGRVARPSSRTRIGWWAARYGTVQAKLDSTFAAVPRRRANLADRARRGWTSQTPCIEVLSDEYGRQTRSYLIERIANSGCAGQRLIGGHCLNERTPFYDVTCCWPWGTTIANRMPQDRRGTAVQRTSRAGVAAPHASLRAASQWCLTQWGEVPPLNSPTTAECNWSVNSLGQVMIAVEHPGRVNMGAPAWEIDFSGNEVQQDRRRYRGGSHWQPLKSPSAQFRQFRADPQIVEAVRETGRLSAIETSQLRKRTAPKPVCDSWTPCDFANG